MRELQQIQAATNAARLRTGNPHVGTRIKAGRCQVVHAEQSAQSGRFDVVALSDYLSLADAVAFLEAQA